MRDARHRTPDGGKSKNNISTPQGGGHNYQDGDLNMIDLNNFISALKTTWLRRMFIYSNVPWVNLALYNVGPIDKLFKLGPENINKIVNRTTNKFWVEVLHSWRRVMVNTPTSDTQSALSKTLLIPRFQKPISFFQTGTEKGLTYQLI